MANDEHAAEFKVLLDEALKKNAALTKENAKLKNRLGKALLENDLSWERDHAVIDGKRHELHLPPLRADLVLDSVKKGFIDADATALVIDRHE